MEGRERPREARPPAAGLRALTQSTRPGPRHLFPPGPQGWGRLLLPAAKFPRLGLPGSPGRCPGQPRRAAAAKAKAGGGAPGGAGEPCAATHPAPGSCCPGPSERGGRPIAGASAGDERGGGESAGRERVGNADPARPPQRLLSRAFPLRLGSSPSAPRRLPGDGRPASDQWGPRGRASCSAHPPPSCLARPALRMVSSARCSPRLTAPDSLARSTAHTPHTPTHSTPTPRGERAQPRATWAPHL